MKDILGSPGTWSGLALRVSQFVWAAASLVAMVSVSGFTDYFAFGFVVLSMGLQLIWSFSLACVDIYSLKTNWDLHNTRHVWKYLIGDWVLGIASMAAASSSAGVVIFLSRDSRTSRVHYDQYPSSSSRYELSVILAFMAWPFLAASAGSTFFLLVSLYE